MKKLLLTILLLTSMLATAQMADSKVPLPPEIAAIKKANILVVAMTKKDNPPFFSGDEEHLHGIDVEIAQDIGKALGVPVKFRRDAESFAEVVEQVRDGRANIAVSKVSVTGPRLQVVRFSQPYLKLKQAMIVNRLWLSQNNQGRQTYQTLREFNGRISYIRNSSYDTFAHINFPKATYVPQDKWDDIVEDVMAGRIAAAYRDEFEIKKISFEKPEAALSTKTITISDSVDNIAVAVDYRQTHLLSIINFVIQNNYSNLDAERLMKRYKAEKDSK
jgi:ABC-type amino acid transport substrate-binding protein